MTDSPDSPARAALRTALVSRHAASERAKDLRAALSRAEAHLADVERAHGDAVVDGARELSASAALVQEWAMSGRGSAPAIAEPRDNSAEVAVLSRALGPAREARDNLRTRVEVAEQLAAEAHADVWRAAEAVLRERVLALAEQLRQARVAYKFAADSLGNAEGARLSQPGAQVLRTATGASVTLPVPLRAVLPPLAAEEVALADTLNGGRDVLPGRHRRGMSPAAWQSWLQALLSNPEAEPPC